MKRGFENHFFICIFTALASVYLNRTHGEKMTFSYWLEDQCLLDDIRIPLEPGTFVILTGVENQAFNLIGGILAGLFPLEHEEQVPRLEELIRIFKGTLRISEGTLPENSVYLGPDPEKHLLFSRVDEEVGTRLDAHVCQEETLALFHLHERFLERRISSLSGGEKMRLALSIAFSKRAMCTVLHGVVPWLDEDGKACLLKAIKTATKEDRFVLLLEQEIDEVQKYSDRVLYFNGRSLHEPEKSLRRLGGRISQVSRMINEGISTSANVTGSVRLRNVDFRYEGDDSEGFHLRELSFELKESRIYGLIGDNGSGKSTIANLMLRLEKPLKGEIFLFGKPIDTVTRKEIMERVCYVSQFPEQHITLSNVQQYRLRAEKCGNTFSVDLLDAYFDSSRVYPLSLLTPLELKILSLASFVTERTGLIILDEPTWGIDPEGLATLLSFLDRIVRSLQVVTVLIITHDFALVKLIGAELMRLDKRGLMVSEPKGTLSKRTQ